MKYFLRQRIQLFFIIVFAILQNSSFAQSQGPQYTIDSLRKILQKPVPAETRVQLAFGMIENFMELDQYDSAQVWLNQVADQLPLKKPTLFNYYLCSRQAEIFYYNGLQRLGLQEAERALQIARSLNDSLLLADSHNFIGLFYMNLDSNFTSIRFFKEGLRYAKQGPHPESYHNLTEPHHLLGNLAEAYVKTVQYDKALKLARESFAMALQAGSSRGMAVATQLSGMVFLRQRLPDSAIRYHQAVIAITKTSGDADVSLLAHGGLALACATLDDKSKALSALQDGFDLLNEKSQINTLFYSQFLDDAIAVYKQYNEQQMLIGTLIQKSDLAILRNKKNDLQMNTLLDEGLKNETRLLNFEVAEAQQQRHLANIRLLLALAALALLVVGLLVYRYTQRQKLRVANIRQKISQDLHDDIGASLSSLQIYGAIAEQTFTSDPPKAMEMIHKIARQSQTVMENMGDIVWSMKSEENGATSLAARIKNYGAELLNDRNISFKYDIQSQAEDVLQSIHARRNIILIIKEAMNNIAKYSKASNAMLSLTLSDNNIVLNINDDGIGFNLKDVQGNGLQHMQQRAKELKGSVLLNSEPGNGTSIIAIFPLAAINDTGW